MPTPTPSATLLEAQQAAWQPLREAYEFEREHGGSWELARVIQERRQTLVAVLSIPDGTPLIERTADGIRVVS